MHTFVLTRIVNSFSDEVSRFHAVKNHISNIGAGISLRQYPLTVDPDGEPLTYLYKLHVDCLKLLRIENTRAQDIRLIRHLLNQLLWYGGFVLSDMTVNRVDFCYNFRIEDRTTRLLLFELLQKCPTKAIYTERGVRYATSIYSRSKSKVVNVYDKNTERSTKFWSTGNGDFLPTSYERDMVRMELQIKKEHLKYMAAHRGVVRSFSNWVNVETERQYLQKLYGMFPKGDFYTLDVAECTIASTNLTQTTKRHLIDFLREIARSDMDTAKNKICYNTYRRYLRILADLGVNPITIPQNCGLPYIRSPFVFPQPHISDFVVLSQ